MINSSKQRIVSLDIFRGIIIWFLLLESIEFFEWLSCLSNNRIFTTFINQFFHVNWIGLSFWDLIQPAFMYIAGVSIAISYTTKKDELSYRTWFKQITFRSIKLLVLGVGLHWVYSESPVFEYQNVLTQLAITTLVTASLIRLKIGKQFVVSLLLILLSSILYRLYNFSEPFLPGKNIGSAFDVLITGYTDSDNWVSLNFLSTSAHTIWGALTGLIILKNGPIKKKFYFLIFSSFLLILVGFLLHISGCEPMIKRIATASFVLVTGGVSMIIFTVLYLIFDVNKLKQPYLFKIYRVSGKNCILTYLLSQTIIPLFLVEFVSIFTFGLFEFIHLPDIGSEIFTFGMLIIIFWKFILSLDKKKISIRL